ncbi:transposase domain-containing protein [Escherichia coli]|nr:transposase domain-containing protein [Escherichia coli]
MKSLTAVRKKSPNYPVEFKIKMVELSHRPEISVAQLAREHGINDNLLFKWRQYWREGKLRPPSTTENNVPELLDGWAEADNNIAENALRMVSLGRKNYLFFGSDHGGERGALLYSLIGTCKLNGVEPESYLRYVLDVIADWPINRVGELLPLARSTAD